MAAGRGTRMGSKQNKIFLTIGNKPVIVLTIQNLMNILTNLQISFHFVVVIYTDDKSYMSDLFQQWNIPLQKITFVVGGDDRQTSVFFGLKAIHHEDTVVLIHDAARPFIEVGFIASCIKMVMKTGAACVGVPVKDTIKQVDHDHVIVDTPPREMLWQVQTPQAFSIDIIKKAHEKANEDGFRGTDDAVLMERLGIPVQMVMGSYRNIKITTPEDLTYAEVLLGE